MGLSRAFVEKHNNNETGYAVVMTTPDSAFFLGLDHHADADRQHFDARRTGLDHLAFAVPGRQEIHDWAAHLDSLGVDHGPVVEGENPVPFAMVIARDPDGISLELIWTGA